MTLIAEPIELDTGSVSDWLATLFPDDTPGLMHISAKNNWNGQAFRVKDRDRAVRYVQSQNQREGVYLRATTLRSVPEKGGRGHAADSLALPGLWADLDIAGPGHKHELCAADCSKGHPHITMPLPPDEDSARQIIAASGLPEPTLWVHSGGGLYPWWMLTRPAIIDDETRDSIAELSAQWQNVIGRAARSLGWTYGTGVGDLARVLRIPGTINRKAGTARPCRVVQSAGVAYTIDYLHDGLAAGVARHPEQQYVAPAQSVSLRRAPTSGEISPLDDFEARVQWDDELLLGGEGWTLRRGTPGSYCEWVRPGKNSRDGLSATTGLDAGRDRLKVFTDATEFQQSEVYTKPGAYALLHHAGDHKAAARRLAQLGFGTARSQIASPSTASKRAGTEPNPTGLLEGTQSLAGQHDEPITPAEFVRSLSELNNDDRLQKIHTLAVTLASGDALQQQRYRNALTEARLIGGADWNRLISDAKRQAKEREKAEARRSADASPPAEHPYVEMDGRTYLIDDKGMPVKLADFVPKVTAETVRDDGAEVNRLVQVRLTMPSGRTAEVEVPAHHLPKARDWAMKAIGPAAVITPMPRDEAHVGTAAQYFGAGQWTTEVKYAHTGWRFLDGVWRFLTTAGALGEHDLDTTVLVDLGSERLNGYRLPDPTGADYEHLRNTIRASINLLDVAPDSTTALMLGAAYQAPLPLQPETSVFLAGPSGSMKSVLAALACQHYGAAFHYKAMPAEWKSSANSLEATAFQLPDVLFAVDDYAPQSVSDPRKLAEAADRVFRGAANASARGRLRPDGTHRPDKYPRAQILATGEDIPPGESLRARLTIATVRPGSVDMSLLNTAQAAAEEGVYAFAMAGYIQWLAGRRNSGEDLAKVVRDRITRYRAELSTGVGHLRAPGAAASLLTAWRLWLEYAVRMSAITVEDAERIFKRVRAAIVGAVAEQAEHTHQMRVEQIYISALVAALAGGKAHLVDRKTLVEPEGRFNPIEWGWKPQDGGAEVPIRWVAQGARIGWLDGDSGEVFLHPDVALEVAVEHAQRARTPLNAGKAAIHQHLEQSQSLVSTTRDKQTGETKQATVVKRIGKPGKLLRVLHLRPEVLTGERPADEADEAA